MIFFILKISILSFILIFVIHNILLYLQKTLTTPKLKDLVLVTLEHQIIFQERLIHLEL